jgi:uncharacterized protein (DUF2249 family)
MTKRTAAPVAPTDRVSEVLARDEALVDVFVRHAAHFEKLRSATMRRVMARLVTVEQAARIAGVPVHALVRDLNAALHIDTDPGAVTRGEHATDRIDEDSGRRPGSLREVELDVREDMRAGREPFSRIMAEIARLRPDELLHLRTIFEPVPLFGLLEKRGFSHEKVRNGAHDWSVWFWCGPRKADARGSDAQVSPRPESPAIASVDAVEMPTVWLDVRGLEPPEPLVRTLAALESVPAGHQLVQINARVPQLLLPMLAERGFACEVDDSRADEVRVRIWRADDSR